MLRKEIIFSDWLITVALFLLAIAVATQFIEKTNIKPQFYQRNFAPAIVLACGDRVAAQGTDRQKATLDFLSLKTRSIKCEDVAVDIANWPRNYFQSVSRYLIGSVGLVWKGRGVSWDVLAPLYGLLYACSIVAAYGIFRLGTGRIIALAAALFLTFSDLQLNNLPHLRDYAKAPFILAILLAIGLVVRFRLNKTRLVLLSIAAGAITGLALGFRRDILVFIPIYPLVLFFFAREHFNKDLGIKFISVLGFFGLVVLVGWPSLHAMGEGGNILHVILLGLMSPFDVELGIKSAPYEWGYLYDDAYVNNILNSFAHRINGVDHVVRLASREYDQIGLRYYIELASHFPADLLTRYYAAALKTLQLVRPGWLASLMPWVVTGCWVVLAGRSILLALFVGGMVLFLAGYPSLQFHERHFFHLQIVPFFFLGLFLQQIATGTMSVWSQYHRSDEGEEKSTALFRYDWRSNIPRVVVFYVLVTIVLLGGLWGARMWQQEHLAAFIKKYEKAETSTVPLVKQATSEGMVRFLLPVQDGSIANSFPVVTRYWALDFDSRKCDSKVINTRVAYDDSSGPWCNLSRSISLDIVPSASYFFVTYEQSPKGFFEPNSVERRLLGVDLHDDEATCLVDIREVKDLTQFPLLPNLLLHPGWQENERLYQRLGDPAPVRGEPYLRFPSDLKLPFSQAKALLERIGPASQLAMRDQASIVALGGDGIVGKGKPASPFSYLLQLPAEAITSPRIFIAEGELLEGGMTFGMLKDNQWASQINITGKGKFVVAIEQRDGVFTPTLANNLPDGTFNHFLIRKMGWVE